MTNTTACNKSGPPFPWRRVPREQRRRLRLVRDWVRLRGVTVYAVGGWVRDMLLHRPQKDIDFVCEEEPWRGLASLAKRCRATLIRHERFMTAKLIFPDGSAFDFVRARREVYDRPGALPRVQPGTLEDDLRRRDFTINAMAVPLDGGGIIDPTGGLADLEAGLVRILHAGSFHDDPTRMLRAVRFEQRFGFRLERDTRRALGQAVAIGAFQWVTRERYAAEFRKGFSEHDPLSLLHRWHQLGLDAPFNQGRRMRWTILRRLKERLPRKPVQTMLRQSGAPLERIWWLAYVLCSSDDGPDETAERWGMTRAEKQAFAWLWRLWPRRHGLSRMTPGRLTVRLMGCPDDVLVILAAAGPSRLAGLLRDIVVRGRPKAEAVTARRLLVWGCPQGEPCGRLLNELRRAVVDGEVNTAVQQRRFVVRWLERHHGRAGSEPEPGR